MPAGPIRRRRAAVIRLASRVGFVAILPFLLLHYATQAFDIATVQGLALGGLVIAGLAERARWVDTAGHVLCATLYGTIAYTTYVSGGLSGPAAIWFAAVAWLAVTVTEGRARWGWFGLVSVTIVVIAGLSPVDQRPPAAVLPSLGATSNALFVLGTGMAVLVLNGVVLRLTRQIGTAERRAAEANRDKDQFLADMSHQFRTPLTTIVGYTEVLAEEAEDEGRNAALRDLGRIELASRSLLPILDDILDVARLGPSSSADAALSPGPVDLESLEAELRAAIEPLAKRRNNTLSLEIDAPSYVPVLDEGRLRQILLNLLGNACKFTQDGRITLRLWSAAQGKLHFEVEDTGIGMDAEQQARVFLPFEQATNTIRDAYGGTGLGLAICKRLAEAMGGELGVESTPGEGTRFWGTLPARRAVA